MIREQIKRVGFLCNENDLVLHVAHLIRRGCGAFYPSHITDLDVCRELHHSVDEFSNGTG